MLKLFKKIGLVAATGAVTLGRGVIGGPLTTIAGIALPVLQIASANKIDMPQTKQEWAQIITTAVISSLLLAADDPKLKKGETNGQ